VRRAVSGFAEGGLNAPQTNINFARMQSCLVSGTESAGAIFEPGPSRARFFVLREQRSPTYATNTEKESRPGGHSRSMHCVDEFHTFDVRGRAYARVLKVRPVPAATLCTGWFTPWPERHDHRMVRQVDRRLPRKRATSVSDRCLRGAPICRRWYHPAAAWTRGTVARRGSRVESSGARMARSQGLPDQQPQRRQVSLPLGTRGRA